MTGAAPSDAVRERQTEVETRRLVMGAAAISLIASLAFRGWALSQGWFYYDDYVLLSEATGRRMDVEYLLTPYTNQLMPGGRLLAWWVAASGALNWPLAAGSILLLQLAASASALWMLLTLFGARWSVVALLNLYLWSAITLPAMLWWAAALNQIPLQCAFFLAVGAWVRYLRTRRTVWLGVTVAALVLGMLFYVKALLIVGVLAFLLVAYFVHGTATQRCRSAVRDHWPSLLAIGGVVGVYLAYYVANVPSPFTGYDAALTGRLADSMVGTAFATGAVGGPWRWSAEPSLPASAMPPLWAQHAAWVVLILVGIYAALRRSRTGRAWILLIAYLAALWGLLLNSRATGFGEDIGLQYRYLADAAGLLVLCVGLVFLPVLGAVESSEPRPRPSLTWRAPNRLVAGLVLCVCVSALVSSWQYTDLWRTRNISDLYLANLASELQRQGAVDLADQVVPEAVLSALLTPDNTTAVLAPLVSERVSFPDSSSNLALIAPDGTLASARIEPGPVSEPGDEECGWLVGKDGRSIPLTGEAFDWTWWMRIGYLAPEATPVVVTAGGDSVEASVQPGLNDLYVKVDGGFDSVRIDGLAEGATMCVEVIEVGRPTPGLRFE